MNKRIDDYKTARVDWRLGLALQPAHFYAQEASIREEIYARAALQAAPAWGVAHAVWDDKLLRDGLLTLSELVLIMPSGVYLDVPGNSVVTSLDLTKSNLQIAPVFAHFLAESSPMPEDLDDPRDLPDVDYLRQHLELSTKAELASAAQRPLKLAEFADDAGTWRVSSSYIPPSLSVQLPFFVAPLGRTRTLCDEFERAINDELRANYLAAETHTAATHALRGLWRMKAQLADIEAGLRVHPLDFFRELRALYLDVCLFRKVQPRFAHLPYQHRDIAQNLLVLLVDLEAQFDVPGEAPRYHELKLNADGQRTCELPPGLTRASDAFLLVQKPDVATAFDIGAFKFSSLERLQIVHQRALTGLVLEPLLGPPFYHGLSASVAFFKPSPGAEWDHVIKARNLAVSNSKRLDGFRLFLYAPPSATHPA